MAGLEDLKSLDIILTTNCNLTCSYCYQKCKNPQRMTWETLRAALKLALGTHCDEIELLFYGGEPLLEFPLISRAVSYIENLRSRYVGVRYALITNGILLDQEKAKFLALHRFETQLSFDGITHAQNLRGEGTFVILDKLLERLISEHSVWFREKLSVIITLSSKTIPYLADSFDYFLNKGLREISINPLFTHDAGWENDLFDELDRQFARMYRSSRQHYLRTGEVPLVNFRKTLPGSPYRSGKGNMCSVIRGDALAIDVDGQLFGCVAFADSFGMDRPSFWRERLDFMRLGDLHDPVLGKRLETFPDAVRRSGIFTNRAKKYSSSGRCCDCPNLSTCIVCPASIIHIPGNTDANLISDFMCAYSRVSHKYREQFPRQTNAIDVLTGNMMIPELMKEFRQIVGSIRKPSS